MRVLLSIDFFFFELTKFQTVCLVSTLNKYYKSKIACDIWKFSLFLMLLKRIFPFVLKYKYQCFHNKITNLKNARLFDFAISRIYFIKWCIFTLKIPIPTKDGHSSHHPPTNPVLSPQYWPFSTFVNVTVSLLSCRSGIRTMVLKIRPGPFRHGWSLFRPSC